MSEKEIIIKGAREHNLKNVNVRLPRNKFIVFTGLSGSGKSTLAFDTIFAEGQRRYLESLSSYARQFLGQLDKPDVDHVEGLSPAISIDQKSASHNPRSTVGTVTEIQDYLRLLYSKIGIPHCSVCGRKISKVSTEEIVEKIIDLCIGKNRSVKEVCRVEILAPVVRDRKGEYTRLLGDFFTKGFSGAFVDGKLIDLVNWKKIKLTRYKKHSISVVVDRVEVTDDNISRIFEGVETALGIADGLVEVVREKKQKDRTKKMVFNQKLSCAKHDVEIAEMEPRLFSFNSPFGACPECEGLGSKKEINVNLVMPDKNKTIAEGGIMPWSYRQNNYYGTIFKAVCKHFSISQNTRIKDLSEEEIDILLNGPGGDYDDLVTVKYYFKSGSGHYNMRWGGVVKHLLDRYRKTQSDSVRREVEKYMSDKPCSVCGGSRYKKDALLITVGGKNIAELSDLSVKDALQFIKNLKLSANELLIAQRIVKEVENRLSFFENVGLEYLTLGRAAATLSGGEAQRIRLASQIGAGLVGVLYILDEPSIGLACK